MTTGMCRAATTLVPWQRMRRSALCSFWVLRIIKGASPFAESGGFQHTHRLSFAWQVFATSIVPCVGQVIGVVVGETEQQARIGSR